VIVLGVVVVAVWVGLVVPVVGVVISVVFPVIPRVGFVGPKGGAAVLRVVGGLFRWSLGRSFQVGHPRVRGQYMALNTRINT